LPFSQPTRRIVALGRQGPPPLLRVLRDVRLEPPEPDLVAVEEAPELGAGRVPPVAEDDRPVGSRLGDEALQAARAGEAIARQAANLLPDRRHVCGDGVVVVQLDPEDARRLRGPERGGLGCSERDRDLPEDVAGLASTDHALHAVDEPDHLDPALEQPEERRLVALVNRALPGGEADIGRDPTEPVAGRRLEVRKDLDTTELIRRQHSGHRTRPTLSRGTSPCEWERIPRTGRQPSPGSEPGRYSTNLERGRSACSFAYASAGLVVSRSTLAPWRAATSETG